MHCTFLLKHVFGHVSFSFSKSEYVRLFKLIGGKDSFKAIFVRHLQIGLRDKLIILLVPLAAM